MDLVTKLTVIIEIPLFHFHIKFWYNSRIKSESQSIAILSSIKKKTFSLEIPI